MNEQRDTGNTSGVRSPRRINFLDRNLTDCPRKDLAVPIPNIVAPDFGALDRESLAFLGF